MTNPSHTQRPRRAREPGPITVKYNVARSLSSLVRDIILQAEERQRATSYPHYAEATLQHLIAAKLDCTVGREKRGGNSQPHTTPEPGPGGLFVGDVAIHVAMFPRESDIARCREDIKAGLRPIMVTPQRGLRVAEGLAANAGLSQLIDIFEIEQLFALNIYRSGRFTAAGRKAALKKIVKRHNESVRRRGAAAKIRTAPQRGPAMGRPAKRKP